MRLSISNIAWSSHENEAIIGILEELSVTGLEIAPTKVWSTPIEQASGGLTSHIALWKERGLEISALQSLLFGRPDLTIFGDERKRKDTMNYLEEMISLGAKLGAKALVLGSPKNRLIGHLTLNEAIDIAIPFFSHLGEVAAAHGTTLCMEPNPDAYGCDFIRNTGEGIQLVREINHPGFRLHLDAGAMTINEENLAASLNEAFPYLAHFHISEPYLQQVKHGKVDHQTIARELKQLHYERYVSIEMLEGAAESNPSAVRESLCFVQETYFG